MRLILHCFLGVLLGSVSMISFPAFAQTPDGETPANEGVCDGLIGSTPGLYGLCVAFCEAQDVEAILDPATGSYTFTEGSLPSSPKLLEIYNKRRAIGDPLMPCVNVVPTECPCWTEAEIASVGGLGNDVCEVDSDRVGGNGALLFDGSEFAAVANRSCFFRSSIPEVFRILGLTQQEAAICRQSVIDECGSRGL